MGRAGGKVGGRQQDDGQAMSRCYLRRHALDCTEDVRARPLSRLGGHSRARPIDRRVLLTFWYQSITPLIDVVDGAGDGERGVGHNRVGPRA